MRKPSLGNAFSMILMAFFGFGLQKASFSIGFIRFLDLVKQHAIYSENLMLFKVFSLPEFINSHFGRPVEIFILHLHSSFFILHSSFFILHSSFFILHSAIFILHLMKNEE